MSEVNGGKRSVMLWGVVLVSLGINLFLAGSWVGTLMRPGAWPPPPGHGPLQNVARDLQGRITPDSMAKVEALIVEIDRRIRSGSADPRRLDEQMRGLLVADTFDTATFTRTVDEFITARTENDRAIARRIAEVVAGMPVADRKVLAEVVLRPRGPPGPPLGDPPPGPPPR
ncbi:MAG: periplasmic heavy metal sensor [Rhodoplanes sp.]|uniref:periplasmic heavy metal sensor n=1 Tax=Rhodoplanes sp. TaxID=1968906 RepID=UPI0017BF727D|nr:periplasmic heavy metal sensor [Rhodoplanes sp.]NVO16634.1 periplasmic heavy metal sensor [Rhodoplanes sp.]